MAKAELFEKAVSARVLRFLNAYPVDRRHVAPEVFAHTEELLTSGRPVVIFPEGGVRRGPKSVFQAGALKKGVGHFSANTHTPVVPILVTGTPALEKGIMPWLKLRLRPKAERPLIAFGKPIYPPAHLSPDEAADYMTYELKAAVRELAARHAPQLFTAKE